MNNFMCFITFQWICLLDRQFIHPRFIVMYLLLWIVIRSFQGQIRKKSSYIRTFYYAYSSVCFYQMHFLMKLTCLHITLPTVMFFF